MSGGPAKAQPDSEHNKPVSVQPQLQPQPEANGREYAAVAAPPPPILAVPTTVPYPPTPNTPYDVEKAEPSSETGGDASYFIQAPPRPLHRRSSNSWDFFKKIEAGFEGFDTRNATQAHLAFAEGDIPNNKATKVYNYLLNVSVITRWIIFVLPVLALIWIPGILGLTAFRKATVWGVKLLWWSIWLSVVWVGWWAALAFAFVLPKIIRATVGTVAVGSRRYIGWLIALYRYVALFAWTLANWVSFTPLIVSRQAAGASDRDKSALDIIRRLAFAFMLCAAVLLFEKFSIQLIAGKFHERSYADRIADQKFAIRTLAKLYRHSRDLPGRRDALGHAGATTPPSLNTTKLFKAALKGVKVATTAALGNVASEITGSSVLQPNSPPAVVKDALDSANKSRLLARRIFYSFVKPSSDSMVVEDIAPYFQTAEEADAAFALFDRDSNGDATRDEVEAACLEFHREQLAIQRSLQDLDSAVGRLDNILMSVYVVVAALIIAVALQTQLVALVTGAGTLILGLSWLIGGSLQEVLTSIIFLFVKHPFDVGDKVNIEKTIYNVKEIRLLSTVFLDTSGALVQAPNVVLNSKFIQNIRRSPQMSESFEFEVAYSTTFEQLQELRAKMMEFVVAERRDFQPMFDVVILDFPDQDKMVLSADIKYKSNIQQGPLKIKRRNKWLCALKTTLAELKIYGPKGDPGAAPGTQRYTIIPWEEVQAEEKKAKGADENTTPIAEVPNLSARSAVAVDSGEDVFGEASQLYRTNPRPARAGQAP